MTIATSGARDRGPHHTCGFGMCLNYNRGWGQQQRGVQWFKGVKLRKIFAKNRKNPAKRGPRARYLRQRLQVREGYPDQIRGLGLRHRASGKFLGFWVWNLGGIRVQDGKNDHSKKMALFCPLIREGGPPGPLSRTQEYRHENRVGSNHALHIDRGDPPSRIAPIPRTAGAHKQFYSQKGEKSRKSGPQVTLTPYWHYGQSATF